LESSAGGFNLVAAMTSLWHLANAQLRSLAVYEPGKPIEEMARELNVDPSDIVKLTSNENPLGPSPRAIAAMQRAINSAHMYPDGSGLYLRNALARRLRLERNNIILGNGSNEIIEFLGHAFLTPDADVVISRYAFVAYKIIGTLFGARVIEARSRAYEHDLEAILAAVTAKTKLVFIANPNNPTGTLLGHHKIDNFMSRVPADVVVAIDEAYFELLDDPPDAVRYVLEGRNVIVLRTFSKVHGLASLRVGYGIARCELIDILQKTREPFNVNGIAQAGALAALEDVAHQRETKRVIAEGRAYLQEQFAALKLEFVPSAANFIMVNVGDGPGVFEQLLQRKIIVRPLTGYGLPAWLRISVGTMPENQKCISALKEVIQEQRRSESV
jgi:histidinol-phosphate aminotransferase